MTSTQNQTLNSNFNWPKIIQSGKFLTYLREIYIKVLTQAFNARNTNTLMKYLCRFTLAEKYTYFYMQGHFHTQQRQTGSN